MCGEGGLARAYGACACDCEDGGMNGRPDRVQCEERGSTLVEKGEGNGWARRGMHHPESSRRHREKAVICTLQHRALRCTRDMS